MANMRMPQKGAYPSTWESSPRMAWSRRLIRTDAADRLKSAVNSIARRASAGLLLASAVSFRPSSIRSALSVSAISAVVVDIRVSVSDSRKPLSHLHARAILYGAIRGNYPLGVRGVFAFAGCPKYAWRLPVVQTYRPWNSLGTGRVVGIRQY